MPRPAALVAVMLVAVGAGAAPLPSRLEGQVFVAGSLAPLPGALVEVAGGELLTCDPEGRFTLTLAPGTVELVVSASGFVPLRVTEALPANTRRTVAYHLVPRADRGRPRYRTVVRREAIQAGDRFTLREEELQQIPGAVGDPFRVVASLPGVVAPVPLLPLYVVRGGSPGMNGFFLDGMRVPQLFHLMLTDGVVHPRILDRLEFYSGSYDATFGRVAAGVIDAGTRPGRSDAPAHGELELRLYDVSALVEVRLPREVRLLAAGRYGFPGPLVQLVQPGVEVSYWDYQLRLDWRGLTVEALGSYDSLAIDFERINGRPGGIAAQFLVEFHRVQVRERYERGPFNLEAAVVGGLDRMSVLSGQGVQKLGLSARLHARLSLPGLTVAAGLDGELSRFSAERFTTDDDRAAPDALGDLAGSRDGIVAGAYLQASLLLERWLRRPAAITVGLRADLYHAATVTLLGLDPRLTFRYAPLPALELFGGFGQYSQAPSFPVPLPGIDTFALQLGLQRAWQGSAGLRLMLPQDFTVSATGYYGRFDNINDVVIDVTTAACTSPPPESIRGLAAYVTRQVKGQAFGLELLARKQGGVVSGWLSYTLSRAERVYSCGLGPSDFDQTHVLTAVVQARLPWRLVLGGRFTVSTGRPYTRLEVDLAEGRLVGSRNNARFPTYFQADLRLDREWIFKRWALTLFLEVINLTYSETVYGVTFPVDPMLMVTRYDQPQFAGFRWILPSLGARGRF